MRKSIATVCLSGSIAEKIRASAAAGFDAVEIFENDLIVSTLSPADIARLAADEGVGIDLYQPFRDFEAVPEPLFRNNLRRAKAKFEVMEALGTDMILVCSNVATASISDDALAAEQLSRLADAAAEHGIRIAYEALAWGTYVSDIEHADRIIAMADNPALGQCIDSFHMLSRGWDPSAIDRLTPGKVFFCQIADAPRLTMDALSWSRHHRVFPGEGGWDLPAFMAHLAGTGYGGAVSLEIFNDVFRQTPVERTAVDAMRSLVWLEDQTAERLAARAPLTPRPTSLEFDLLPEVAQPTGFTFAEIKAPSAPLLEEALGQLGFDFTGDHRSKPVRLWTQGSARIIVNAQDAHADQLAISAVGFDVADPNAAVTRAQALFAVEVPRANAEGEEVLRGFSAPDAKEVFLCQSAAEWTSEFSAPKGAPDEAADQSPRSHIVAIDHINLAQPWQYFDEAVLFYESTLSLAAQPAVEVAAPNGLVRSQVMRADDGSVRLALNIAPLLAETSPDHAAPEHIAFVSDDIFATARAAISRGMTMLPIPANYYRDLAARLPLSAADIDALAEFNLLYDRDGDGEFLQFYTATIGNVFLEVVQRRGGYQGYGAGNAPIRLAAQFEFNRRQAAARTLTN